MYQKAPTVGTMLLSGIMLKMGLYSVIRWQLPIAPLAAKEYMHIFIGLGIAGVIYGSIVALRQKDLKKLLAYSSLAHVGLIAAGSYTLTLDGLRGAVLQMIAHGFVIVGLFFAAEIIFRRYETRTIAEMGGIRSQSPKFTSMFMILVLASVALPSTFNFVGEFTVLYSLSQINIWFAILGWNYNYSWSLLYAENVSARNVGRNQYKNIQRCDFQRRTDNGNYHCRIILFWNVPKTNYRFDYAKS